MLTIVLSGAATGRPQAVAALRQAGLEVTDSNHSHGFEQDDGETFITAHGADLDAAARVVSPLGFGLRSHWETVGEWQKVGGHTADPSADVTKLRAQLRAAGIKLGDD